MDSPRRKPFGMRNDEWGRGGMSRPAALKMGNGWSGGGEGKWGEGWGELRDGGVPALSGLRALQSRPGREGAARRSARRGPGGAPKAELPPGCWWVGGHIGPSVHLPLPPRSPPPSYGAGAAPPGLGAGGGGLRAERKERRRWRRRRRRRRKGGRDLFPTALTCSVLRRAGPATGAGRGLGPNRDRSWCRGWAGGGR